MATITRKSKDKTRQSFLVSLASLLQIAVTVLAGLFCGAIVANIQLGTGRILNTSQRPGSQQEILATDGRSECRLPSKSKKITIPTSSGSYFELAVWDDGDYLTDQLAKDGFWEIIEPSGMADLGDTTLPSPETSVFWDIGSNVGYYSFLFAKAGYRVIAFEPENTNAALFGASLCLNPTLAKKITLVPKALTSKEPKNNCKIIAQARAERMKRYLHLIPRLMCDTRCKRMHSICQDVKLTTLDEALNSHPAPTVLKIDVEGHELAVLKGGSDTFFKKNPPVVIQFENRDSRNEADIATLLEGHGYRIGEQRGHDSNTVAVLRSYGDAVEQ